MKIVTLLFLVDAQKKKVLLAMKKRGFGEGKYNGMGGKVEAGESIESAAVREAREEVGVEVREEDLRKCALLHFSFEEKPDWAFECHAFLAGSWKGVPAETEEMAPEWFATDAIPYDRMWIDDKHWLPQALAGEILQCKFHFNNDGSEILQQKVEVIVADR